VRLCFLAGNNHVLCSEQPHPENQIPEFPHILVVIIVVFVVSVTHERQVADHGRKARKRMKEDDGLFWAA
jgi:hypothetical protein